MAASLNKVFLIGNLTRDPELRYIPSGTAVTNFSLAVNRSYKSRTGEMQEDVTFVRIVVWARMAEVCAEYLSKGRPVFVEGRLQTNSWETESGEKRSTMEVVATNVQFLGSRGDGGSSGAPGGKASREAYGEKAPLENVETIDLDSGEEDEEAPF